jgi:hypothetical protein
MPPTGQTPDEGIELSPATQIDLIAMRASRLAILEHIKLCPFNIFGIEQRVRSLENRFALLIGYMLGAGLIGGTAGAFLIKTLAH